MILLLAMTTAILLLVSVGGYYAFVSREAWDGKVHFSEAAVMDPFVGSNEAEVHYNDDHVAMTVTWSRNVNYTLVLARKKWLSWVLKGFAGSSSQDFVRCMQIDNVVYLCGIVTHSDAQSVALTGGSAGRVEPAMCQILKESVTAQSQSIAFVFKLEPEQILTTGILTIFGPDSTILNDDIWDTREYTVFRSGSDVDTSDTTSGADFDSVYQQALQTIQSQKNKQYVPLLVSDAQLRLTCSSAARYAVTWEPGRKTFIFTRYQETVDLGLDKDNRYCYSLNGSLLTSDKKEQTSTIPNRISYLVNEEQVVDTVFDMLAPY